MKKAFKKWGREVNGKEFQYQQVKKGRDNMREKRNEMK